MRICADLEFAEPGGAAEHDLGWEGVGAGADSASFAPTATIDHNLFAHFTVEKPVGSPYSLTRGARIFGEGNHSFRPSRTDRISLRPRFRNPRRGDFRLAGSQAGIGIDWDPSRQHYGPAS